MAEQPVQDQPRSARVEPDTREEGASLIDGIRFLYRRRARLAVRFIVFFGLGVVAMLVFVLTSGTSVQGSLALAFKGIERHEYPSGRKFSVEGFRSPDVLKRALADVGIPDDRVNVRRLSAGVSVTPVIPSDVQARWRRQERDGARKDEYFPSEFVLTLQVPGLSRAQDIRLFDAIVKNYQTRVKQEQPGVLSFVASGANLSYEALATKYDFWDVPMLFAETFKDLDAEVEKLIAESLQFEDVKYQLRFRNLARDLANWRAIRLAALEAMTYQGRLVKDKDLVLERLRYRIDLIDIRIKQKANEASEGLRLLSLIDRPKTAITGSMGDRATPTVDAGALDKLVKNDYVGPVVAKVAQLQTDAQMLEADRARLQRQLAALPKATNITLAQLPPGHRELVQTLSAELRGIVDTYNRILDEYLTATVTSLVTVRQAPMVVRENSSFRMLALMLGLVVALSILLAVVVMSIEHLFQKLNAETASGHPRPAR